jgi:hypothetical protein
MYKFNLNNYVHVHLDSEGLEILRKYYNITNVDNWKSNEFPEMHRFQFWEFMDIFGGSSFGSYAPYSTEIFIDKKDLRKLIDNVLED